MFRNHLTACILAACALIACNENSEETNTQQPSTDSQESAKSLIQIAPEKGLMTNEDGTSASFQVSLKTAPGSDVVLRLSGSPSTECTFSPSALTITKDNYDLPQTVTVTGVDDDIFDGNQIFTISLEAESADSDYNGQRRTVDIVNVDNEVSELPHPNTLHYMVPDNGLKTDELGTLDYLEFQLSNRPAYPVYIKLESSNPSEAVPERSEFMIIPDDWNQIIEIPVFGVSDNKADGDQKFKITVTDIQSDDPSINKEPFNYSKEEFGREIEGITYDIDGKELNKLLLTKPSGGDPFDPKRDLTFHGSVSENSDDFLTYSVSLQAPPKNGASVYVIAKVTDPTEGWVEPYAVVFNENNWNKKQEFRIYGADDNEKDGNILFGVNFTTISDDLVSNALTTDHIVVMNIDDESTDDSNFEYALKLEADDAICHTQNDKPIGSTFYVSLNHQPTETVTVDYNVSNVDIAYIETDDSKKVTRTSLEFTPLNWNIKQKIHIVGNQIPELTNDTSYHIDFNTSSKDSHFSKLKNQMYCTHHASQTKMDDDSNIEQSKSFINFSGVNLDGGTTFYNDDVKTFYVSLNKKPASEVKLHFVHRPLSREGMPNLSAYFCDKNGAGMAISGYMTLTFTPDNYNIPQALHFRADKNSRSAIFEHRILLKDVMTDDRDLDISNVKGLMLRFAHQYSGYKPTDESNTIHVEPDEDILPALESAPDICTSYGILKSDSNAGLRFAFNLNKEPESNVKVVFKIPDEYKDIIKFGNSTPQYYLNFKPSNYDLSQYLSILVKDDTIKESTLIPINYTFESDDPEFNAVPLDACKLFIQYTPADSNDDDASDSETHSGDHSRKLRIMSANTTSGSDQMYLEPGMNFFYAMDPDIIIAQEFTRSAKTVVNKLKNYFGTNYTYYAGPGSIGNGIIVKGDLKILKTYSQSSVCTNITDRKYEAAVVDIPGDKDLLVVSLHLWTKAYDDRISQIDEYPAVMEFINKILNDGDYYVVIGGDFNSHTEDYVNFYWSSMMATDITYPRDQKGNFKTNRGRYEHYDWVLVDKEFQKFSVPTQIGSKTFPHGYVLDSRIHTPLSEIAPVQFEDSNADNMQHMAVVRDFVISY